MFAPCQSMASRKAPDRAKSHRAAVKATRGVVDAGAAPAISDADEPSAAMPHVTSAPLDDPSAGRPNSDGFEAARMRMSSNAGATTSQDVVARGEPEGGRGRGQGGRGASRSRGASTPASKKTSRDHPSKAPKAKPAASEAPQAGEDEKGAPVGSAADPVPDGDMPPETDKPKSAKKRPRKRPAKTAKVEPAAAASEAPQACEGGKSPSRRGSGGPSALAPKPDPAKEDKAFFDGIMLRRVSVWFAPTVRGPGKRGTWYAGTVDAVEPPKFHVTFDDGDDDWLDPNNAEDRFTFDGVPPKPPEAEAAGGSQPTRLAVAPKASKARKAPKPQESEQTPTRLALAPKPPKPQARENPDGQDPQSRRQAQAQKKWCRHEHD